MRLSHAGSQALQIVNLLDLAPMVVIAASVVEAVLAPWRGRRLEARYALTDAEQTPALAEIREFVHRCAPGVVVRSRLVRSRGTAFAYLHGYRRPALAVFGGLVVL